MDGLMCFLDEGFIEELEEIIKENGRNDYPLFIGQILNRFMKDMNNPGMVDFSGPMPVVKEL